MNDKLCDFRDRTNKKQDMVFNFIAKPNLAYEAHICKVHVYNMKAFMT